MALQLYNAMAMTNVVIVHIDTGRPSSGSRGVVMCAGAAMSQGLAVYDALPTRPGHCARVLAASTVRLQITFRRLMRNRSRAQAYLLVS